MVLLHALLPGMVLLIAEKFLIKVGGCDREQVPFVPSFLFCKTLAKQQLRKKNHIFGPTHVVTVGRGSHVASGKRGFRYSRRRGNRRHEGMHTFGFFVMSGAGAGIFPQQDG